MSSNKYDLLRQIIDNLEIFEEKYPSGGQEEFGIWLFEHSKNIKINPKKEIDDFSKKQNFSREQNIEVELSTLITTLFRFAKHYIKKALDNTALKTLDEFGFMASLIQLGKLSKSELINRHVLEISSGSEILKRLIKAELIQEESDTNDKRSKLISLTPLGRMELIKAFGEMQKVAIIVNGNLSFEEQKNIIYAFNKLKYFHEHIHKDDKGTDLDELMRKYINKDSL